MMSLRLLLGVLTLITVTLAKSTVKLHVTTNTTANTTMTTTTFNKTATYTNSPTSSYSATPRTPTTIVSTATTSYDNTLTLNRTTDNSTSPPITTSTNSGTASTFFPTTSATVIASASPTLRRINDKGKIPTTRDTTTTTHAGIKQSTTERTTTAGGNIVVFLIIGAAVTALIIVVFVLIICCCCAIKRRQKKVENTERQLHDATPSSKSLSVHSNTDKKEPSNKEMKKLKRDGKKKQKRENRAAKEAKPNIIKRIGIMFSKERVGRSMETGMTQVMSNEMNSASLSDDKDIRQVHATPPLPRVALDSGKAANPAPTGMKEQPTEQDTDQSFSDVHSCSNEEDRLSVRPGGVLPDAALVHRVDRTSATLKAWAAEPLQPAKQRPAIVAVGHSPPKEQAQIANTGHEHIEVSATESLTRTNNPQNT